MNDAILKEVKALERYARKEAEWWEDYQDEDDVTAKAYAQAHRNMADKIKELSDRIEEIIREGERTG
jgi:hypothetical protein